LHLHRQHAETFYILEGDVDFYLRRATADRAARIDGAYSTRLAHAVVLPEGKIGRLLMIFQPAGFDQFLRELAALSEPSSTTRRA